MTSYLIHHMPKCAAQDTWAVSFSLPYIALRYARAGNGLWYVETWLTAEQIAKRLAILFDDSDELHIHALGRDEAAINGRLQWLDGRLEQNEEMSLPRLEGPRAAWAAIQTAARDLAAPLVATFTVVAPRNLRAA